MSVWCFQFFLVIICNKLLEFLDARDDHTNGHRPHRRRRRRRPSVRGNRPGLPIPHKELPPDFEPLLLACSPLPWVGLCKTNAAGANLARKRLLLKCSSKNLLHKTFKPLLDAVIDQSKWCASMLPQDFFSRSADVLRLSINSCGRSLLGA